MSDLFSLIKESPPILLAVLVVFAYLGWERLGSLEEELSKIAEQQAKGQLETTRAIGDLQNATTKALGDLALANQRVADSINNRLNRLDMENQR
jgi:hypothetical protein